MASNPMATKESVDWYNTKSQYMLQVAHLKLELLKLSMSDSAGDFDRCMRNAKAMWAFANDFNNEDGE